MQPIVPGYRGTKDFICTVEEADEIMEWAKNPKEMIWKEHSMTEGHKILSIAKVGEGRLRFVTVGLPWTSDEFVEAAAKVNHPFDREAAVPPAIAKALFNLASQGPSQTKQKRTTTMDW